MKHFLNSTDYLAFDKSEFKNPDEYLEFLIVKECLELIENENIDIDDILYEAGIGDVAKAAKDTGKTVLKNKKVRAVAAAAGAALLVRKIITSRKKKKRIALLIQNESDPAKRAALKGQLQALSKHEIKLAAKRKQIISGKNENATDEELEKWNTKMILFENAIL